MTFLAMGFPLYFGGLLGLYCLVPRRWRGRVLLLGSWLICLRSGPEALAALLLTLGITLVAAGLRRPGLGAGGLLLLLAVFKLRLTLTELALPLGISFYIFRCLGYLLDLRAGKPGGKPGEVALYASFFPQLVQGPISAFSPGTVPEAPGWEAISFGLQRMLWGYFKKLVVADRLAVVTQALLAGSGGPGFWLLSVVYGLQIYADFTGGMDIALGAGQCFGIALPENFRHPFLSRSVAEFWRRWHITLGQWMRSFVFYPLCVSRPLTDLSRRLRPRNKKLARALPVYIATLITWLATGLWHGLTPNFLVWGLLNGGLILGSELLEPVFRRLRRPWMDSRAFDAFRILRTFTLMNLVRLCDLYPDVTAYFRRLGSLFAPGDCPWPLDGVDSAVAALGLAAMAGVSIFQLRRGSLRQALARHPLAQAMILTALAAAVLLLGRYGIAYNSGDFIYNQF